MSTCRWLHRRVPAALSAICGALAALGHAQIEFSGDLLLEGAWFSDEPAYPAQESSLVSAAAEAEWYLDLGTSRSITFAAHLRYDSADSERSYADLRKAYFLSYGSMDAGEWELRVGVDTVFWGVTESASLVDIVNQVDLVDDPDEKSKMGQPMAHLTWTAVWGVSELFLLPVHRQRPFPGESGRNRLPWVVDLDMATYEADNGERHIDAALRFSNSYGLADVGLSYFRGNS